MQKASLCLLELNQGDQAIELCRDILRLHPDMLTAKLGAEWVLSRLVPIWHVPMMNEQERNEAYYEGLKSIDNAGEGGVRDRNRVRSVGDDGRKARREEGIHVRERRSDR